MDDIEEDMLLRERVNIYKRERRASAVTASTMGDDEDAIPDAPTLAEMLDDLDLNDIESTHIEDIPMNDG